MGERLYDQSNEFTECLAEQNFVWKDIVSGYETRLILPLPSGYSSELDGLLLGYDDHRAQLFYGLPQASMRGDS